MIKHKGTNYRLSSLRGYIRLIHEVERVDPEAGKYLRKEAWGKGRLFPSSIPFRLLRVAENSTRPRILA